MRNTNIFRLAIVLSVLAVVGVIFLVVRSPQTSNTGVSVSETCGPHGAGSACNQACGNNACDGDGPLQCLICSAASGKAGQAVCTAGTANGSDPNCGGTAGGGGGGGTSCTPGTKQTRGGCGSSYCPGQPTQVSTRTCGSGGQWGAYSCVVSTQCTGGGRCTNYSYGPWGDCVNGTQNRVVTGYLPSNCSSTPATAAITSRSCTGGTTGTPTNPTSPPAGTKNQPYGAVCNSFTQCSSKNCCFCGKCAGPVSNASQTCNAACPTTTAANPGSGSTPTSPTATACAGAQSASVCKSLNVGDVYSNICKCTLISGNNCACVGLGNVTDGGKCAADTQCTSGNCVSGVCQNNTLKSGLNGSCRNSNDCSSGLTCTGYKCISPTTANNGSSGSGNGARGGTVTPAKATFSVICADGTKCLSGYNCVKNNTSYLCQLPATGSNGGKTTDGTTGGQAEEAKFTVSNDIRFAVNAPAEGGKCTVEGQVLDQYCSGNVSVSLVCNNGLVTYEQINDAEVCKPVSDGGACSNEGNIVSLRCGNYFGTAHVDEVIPNTDLEYAQCKGGTYHVYWSVNSSQCLAASNQAAPSPSYAEVNNWCILGVTTCVNSTCTRQVTSNGYLSTVCVSPDDLGDRPELKEAVQKCQPTEDSDPAYACVNSHTYSCLPYTNNGHSVGEHNAGNGTVPSLDTKYNACTGS